jgi:transcriptional regulator of met regulon
MGQMRNITVLTNERVEVEIANMKFVKRSELEQHMEVTYADGRSVFHQSDCRAQQRINDPKKTSRRSAIEMGLGPCRNCEHPKKARTQD